MAFAGFLGRLVCHGPTGKSLSGNQKFECLSSPVRKNIPVVTDPKSPADNTHPVPTEGRFANVTNAGQDAMDAGGFFDE
jgi:hypothetical protein